MNFKNILGVTFGLMTMVCQIGFAQSSWQSKFVHESNGKLIYFPHFQNRQPPIHDLHPFLWNNLI